MCELGSLTGKIANATLTSSFNGRGKPFREICKNNHPKVFFFIFFLRN